MDSNSADQEKTTKDEMGSLRGIRNGAGDAKDEVLCLRSCWRSPSPFLIKKILTQIFYFLHF